MMTDPTARANDAPEPFDAGDAKQVKASIKSAKQVAVRQREALKGLMSSAEGRMWMHGLLERCGPFHTPFRADAIRMAHACGEQNIGLGLLAELMEACPELYLVMMKENQ